MSATAETPSMPPEATTPPLTPLTPPPLPTLPPVGDTSTPISVAARSRSSTPPPLLHLSTASAARAAADDSGKSSGSSPLFDCSFDSGIGVDGGSNDLQLHKRLQQCKRILSTLERDKEAYRLLRVRLSKIVDRKSKQDSAAVADEEELLPFCNVCCAEIDPADAKTYVTCCVCAKHICRGVKCADWLSQSAQWECQLCHTSKESLAQTSSWVAEQICFNQQKLVYPMRARSEIYIPISDFNDGGSSMHFESVSQIGVNSTATAAISTEQKLKIREYVEEVVAQLLGGSLDNITVGQISKSENYLQLFHNYHPKLSNLLINMENALWNNALKGGDLPALINGQHAPSSVATAPVTRSNSNNNSPLDFADISQARLRQLIEAIIAETLRLPALSSATSAVSEIALDTSCNGQLPPPLANGVSRRHRTEHYFEPKIYQDLLATAVLNKIVDNQGVKTTRLLSESTPDLSGHDPNFGVENQSSSGSSSVEPRSDCSYTDTEQILNFSKGEVISPYDSQGNQQAVDDVAAALGRESAMSDYIAAHMVPLPDLSAPVTESEEDDYISVTSSTIGEGTWEDNWLFKKKRPSLKISAAASGNVGMLVPAPKEDVRAQIGDKTADEVSDLSEMGSDTDDASLDLLRANLDPLNDRLLNKHLIGGQNTKMVLDELIDRASMTSTTLPAENEPKYTETKNEHVLETTAQTEAFNANVVILQTAETAILSPPADFKDSSKLVETTTSTNPLSDQLGSDFNRTDESIITIVETFTADVASMSASVNTTTNSTTTNPKTFSNTKLTNGFLTNGFLTNGFESTSFSNDETERVSDDDFDDRDDDIDIDDVELLRRFVPGSIAEREYMKWNNAVEMPNNPYAPDALKRRISGSQERFMDLPNISPSTEQNPITLMQNVNDEVDASDQNRESDYKRYSRDYYINDAKQTPTIQSPTKQFTSNICDEPAVDNITINEPKSSAPISAPDRELYQALPAQVVEEQVTSIETISPNQSLQSVTTTTSDDSDTVRIYDFHKQETTILPRHEAKATEDQEATAPKQSSTMKARPTELQLGGGGITPTRCATPTAFRFLQPKRKLIEPSQVLSLDETEVQEPTPSPGEKSVIEKEVFQALPSVKALAQAFLMTSNKCTTVENRWIGKLRPGPITPTKSVSVPELNLPTPNGVLEKINTFAEVAEDATIGSDLSSLEVDPPVYTEDTAETKDFKCPSIPSQTQRTGLFRNIAFFENLKFK